MYHATMNTGDARQRYKGRKIGNVFENPYEPLSDMPIGRCLEPHCYNGYMLMMLGLIKGLTDLGYGDIRDRERADGKHWLHPELKAFFNTRLGDSNNKPSCLRKSYTNVANTALWAEGRARDKFREKML